MLLLTIAGAFLTGCSSLLLCLLRLVLCLLLGLFRQAIFFLLDTELSLSVVAYIVVGYDSSVVDEHGQFWSDDKRIKLSLLR